MLNFTMGQFRESGLNNEQRYTNVKRRQVTFGTHLTQDIPDSGRKNTQT